VHITDELIKSGVRAEHVDGNTPQGHREAILGRLASGKTEVVSNCMILTEGFDLPDIGCIALVRPNAKLRFVPADDWARIPAGRRQD